MKIRFCVCILLLVISFHSFAQSDAVKPPVFDHTTIFVTDLQRSADWYEKVLELPVIPEPFHDGKHVWLRASEHAQIHIVKGAKEDADHDINIHLAFSVENIDDFMKHLDSTNTVYGNWAQVAKKTQDRPDGVKQIYLKDPDGYWIEINNDRF